MEFNVKDDIEMAIMEDEYSCQHHQYVTPGTELGDIPPFLPGRGTYKDGISIYAALSGIKTIDNNTIEIIGTIDHHSPRPGSLILARIVRVTPRQVTCDIFAVDHHPLRTFCKGNIRPTDIQPVGIDKMAILDCFRPGDIIRGLVVATGVSRNFLLSTAKAEHGVVRAISAKTGQIMTPISANLMKCPLTGTIELRKVASVVNSLVRNNSGLEGDASKLLHS